MGAGASHQNVRIPGLMSSECVAYTRHRKEAAKDLQAAANKLSQAATTYSDAIKLAGSSLVNFSSGANLYSPTAQSEGALHTALAQEGGNPGAPGGTPQAADMGVAGYGGTPPPPPAQYPPPSHPGQFQSTIQPPAPTAYPPPPYSVPDGVKEVYGTPQFPPTEMNQAAGNPGFNGTSDQTGNHKSLNRYAKQLNEGFLEAAALVKPLVEVLDVGVELDKKSYLPLHPQSAVKADGSPESFGFTIQKIVNWERKLTEETAELEKLQSEIRQNDKKLAKHAKKQEKDSEEDKHRAKMEGAHVKVTDANARLASLTASLGATYNEIETAKSQLVLPQVLRVLPAFIVFWQKSSEVFAHQLHIMSELTSQNGGMVADASGQTGVMQDGALASAAMNLSPTSFVAAMTSPMHGTDKSQHQATKKLLESFKNLQEAFKSLTTSQRKLCDALMAWVNKTKALPKGFPRPEESTQFTPGTATTEGMGGAPSAPNRDELYTALTSDWARALDKLPGMEVQKAISAFTDRLNEAYEQQSKELRQGEKLEGSIKQLSKVEEKLSGTHGEKKVATAKAAVDAARKKASTDRMTLEGLVIHDKSALTTAIEKDLPAILQQTQNYSSASAQNYTLMQAQHAPRLSHGG